MRTIDTKVQLDLLLHMGSYLSSFSLKASQRKVRKTDFQQKTIIADKSTMTEVKIALLLPNNAPYIWKNNRKVR